MRGVLIILMTFGGEPQDAERNTDPSRSSSLPGFLPLGQKAAPQPTQERPTIELIALLKEPAWVRWPNPRTEPGILACPWAHPAVNVLKDRACRDDQTRRQIHARVRELIDSGADIEKFNAALLLVNLRDDRGLPTLSRRLLDSTATIAERTLAAHALVEFPDRLDPVAIGRLLQSIFMRDGSFSDTSLAGDEAKLAAAIAWLWIRCQLSQSDYNPVNDSWINRFSQLAAPELRRAAALAYAGRAWPTIPTGLTRLLEDNEAAVRASALWAVTRHPTGAARDVVLKRTYDVDLEAMAQAVGYLALFPDLKTTQRLQELQSHSSPLIRSAVVRAGKQLRQESLILPALDDPSADVRSCVAGALSVLPPNVADPAWQKLVSSDRSSIVQLEAVASAAGAPAERSVPILLVALNSPVAQTRRAAARRLASHLPQASAFPVDGQPQEREESLAALEKAWTQRAAHRSQVLGSLDSRDSGRSREDIEELLRIWHEGSGAAKDRATARLNALRPADRSTVEKYFLDRDQVPSPEFLQQILAVLDPAYEPLAQLASPSGNKDAARHQLVAQFERRPTTELQALLIARSVLQENSVSLWTSLVPLLFRDHGPVQKRAEPYGVDNRLIATALDRLIARGLNHPEDTVRCMVCNEIQSTNVQKYTRQLAALMEDSSERVRLAAIRAAGSAVDGTTIESLRFALRSRSTAVQIQAAVELCRQGEREGLQALERLFASRDPEVRKRVLAQMANLSKGPHRDGVLSLLTRGLSDESLAVRTQAIAGLEVAVGYTHWGAQSRFVPHEGQIARWKRTMTELFADQGRKSEGLETLREIQNAQETLRITPVAN